MSYYEKREQQKRGKVYMSYYEKREQQKRGAEWAFQRFSVPLQ